MAAQEYEWCAQCMAPAAIKQHACQCALLESAKEYASPGHQLSIDGCDPKLQGSSLHDSLLKTDMVLCSIPSSSLCDLEWHYVLSVQPHMIYKEIASWASHAARCCHCSPTRSESLTSLISFA